MSTAAAQKPTDPTHDDVAPAISDIAATGPRGLGAIVGRKPSEKEREASALRKKLGHLVEALVAGAVPMKRPGACLMAAHMVAELGEAKASKMTRAEVEQYAANFRSRYPIAWGAASQQNYLNFVRHMQMGGLRDAAEDRATIVKEYQAVASALLAG